MENNIFQKAFQFIKTAKTVAVTAHIRPDGDSVGSTLAMKMAIESLGKTADVFIDGIIPKQFFYINGFNEIFTNAEDIKKIDNKKYDLLIIVDCNDETRLGNFGFLRNICKNVVCFDHHLGTYLKGDIVISMPEYASCGEILYDFFKENGVKITKDIATALYTSISTDTGCFLYASTSAYTHRVTAEILDIGVDLECVHYHNFRVYDIKLLTGLKQVLHNLQFESDGKIVVTCLRFQKNKKYQYDHEERHKFQRYATDAKGVKASIFMTEDSPNQYHVSLRSHGDVNISIPAKIFGGGGHKNAAGFTISGNYKQLVKQIVSEVEKVL